MSDVESALAFVARRQGRRTMPASNWQGVLSLELGWMTPGEASAFVASALEVGLLEEDGENLHLSVDPKSVDIPAKFRPNPAAKASKPKPLDPFLQWVEHLAKARKTDRQGALAMVSNRQDESGGLLTAQAAVLLLASEAGLNVASAAAEALADLQR